MQSMLASLSEPIQPMQALQQQQQQQQPQTDLSQHQQILAPAPLVGHTPDQQQTTTTTMTVLETLDSSQSSNLRVSEQQQVSIEILDSSQQHLGLQQQQMMQHQPQLHQLQPSHTSAGAGVGPVDAAAGLVAEGSPKDQQINGQSMQQQQQNSENCRGGMSNHLLRQRSQHIEGIVADGGGPIVQWLLDNYEIAEGESLPRSTVYNHYLAHCRQLQMASVNAASFGKLIRSVFVGLKTRRLGTRGHSKYHYFGVRAKQHAEQEILQFQLAKGAASCSRDQNDNSNNNTDNGSDSDSTANECGRHSSGSSSKRVKRTHNTNNSQQMNSGRRVMYQQDHQHQTFSSEHHQQDHIESQQHRNVDRYYNVEHNSNPLRNGYLNSPSKLATNNNISHQLSCASVDQQANCEQQLMDFRNYLGANWETLVDEHWPQREPCILENELAKVCGSNELAGCLAIFEAKYRWAYKHMLELLSELKFMQVERMWYDFWHLNQSHQSSNHWPQQSSTNNQDSNCQQQQEKQQLIGDHVQHHHQQQHIKYDQQQQQETDQPQMSQHILHHQQLHHYHQPQQAPQQQQQQQQQPQPQPHQLSQPELNFEQLYQLTSQAYVIDRINQIDYHLYEAIGSFLLPDMLSPIPFALAQQIRQFAMNIGPSSEKAIKDYDPRFVTEKSKSAWAFGSALRRYACLNHLSTASRAIWEKRTALAQMSLDLSRIDLRDIEHQASLMSRKQHTETSTATSQLMQPSAVNELHGPNHNQPQQPAFSVHQHQHQHQHQHHLISHELTAGSVQALPGSGQAENKADTGSVVLMEHQHHLCAMQPAQLIQNFLHLLEDPYPANSWPDWCRNLVESRVCGLSMEEARSFVLKWNFYISLIMKELTLRSADSFSSFQLIRMLFDEYIFYLVVSRLAASQHKTPCQLLSQLSSQLS